MSRILAALLIAFLGAGCAMLGEDKTSRNFTAFDLQVDGASNAREVLIAVPLESAMERFELVDRKGCRVSYVAFTETDYGGLLFLDNKLYGTVSKRDARGFYSCRGYVSATHTHWAHDASEWTDALLAASAPVGRVTLHFAGKTTMQSIKEAVNNPALSEVKSLVDMGTNPFGIFRTLSTAHSNLMDREKYDKTLHALYDLMPGDSETKLAKIVRPEDMSFTSDGLVMAYPSFLLDFYVNDGIVKVLQQPSFHRLSRLHAAIFYVPGLRWDRCTPGGWREALPPDWKPPPPDEEAQNRFGDDLRPGK